MSLLTNIIARFKADQQIDAEVDAFPIEELELMGLTRADLRKIAHMPAEQIARLEKMAETFGTSVNAVHRAGEHVHVANRCAHCDCQTECRNALAANKPAADMEFCPNADTYRDLAV